MIMRLLAFMLAGMSTCAGSELTNAFSSDQTRYTITNPKMIWGEVTNFLRGDLSGNCLPTSLRSGIDVSGGVIVLSGKPLRPQHPARLFLQNYSGPAFWTFPTKYDQGVAISSIPTTNWVFAYMPPASHSLAMSMTDSNDTPVSKTPLGSSTGQQPALRPKTVWYRFEKNNHGRFGLLPKEVQEITELSPLDPARYFALEVPGLYKLTLALRIFVMDTNSYVRTVTLPQVDVDVLVEN